MHLRSSTEVGNVLHPHPCTPPQVAPIQHQAVGATVGPENVGADVNGHEPRAGDVDVVDAAVGVWAFVPVDLDSVMVGAIGESHHLHIHSHIILAAHSQQLPSPPEWLHSGDPRQLKVARGPEILQHHSTRRSHQWLAGLLRRLCSYCNLGHHNASQGYDHQRPGGRSPPHRRHHHHLGTSIDDGSRGMIDVTATSICL